MDAEFQSAGHNHRVLLKLLDGDVIMLIGLFHCDVGYIHDASSGAATGL